MDSNYKESAERLSSNSKSSPSCPLHSRYNHSSSQFRTTKAQKLLKLRYSIKTPKPLWVKDVIQRSLYFNKLSGLGTTTTKTLQEITDRIAAGERESLLLETGTLQSWLLPDLVNANALMFLMYKTVTLDATSVPRYHENIYRVL